MSVLRPFLLILLLLAPLPARAERVPVYAAASLKTALDAVVPAFEAATGHEAVVSFAGSSALARQIGQGAPAGIFISANMGWMDQLGAEGHLMPGTRRDLLRNTLVLIGTGETTPEPVEIGEGFPFADHLGDGRLAMALVDAVPAGIYGKAALEALGAWDAVSPRVAQADNVRAALALVASGEAPLGVVYATDAHAEPRVHVIGTFPETSHQPIIYPVAATTGAGPAAMAFLDYLGGEEARDVFTSEGFVALSE